MGDRSFKFCQKTLFSESAFNLLFLVSYILKYIFLLYFLHLASLLCKLVLIFAMIVCFSLSIYFDIVASELSYNIQSCHSSSK